MSRITVFVFATAGLLSLASCLEPPSAPPKLDTAAIPTASTSAQPQFISTDKPAK